MGMNPMEGIATTIQEAAGLQSITSLMLTNMAMYLSMQKTAVIKDL